MNNFFVKSLLLMVICLNFSFVFALSPEERLQDENLEKQANELFLEVRCLSCNGQVIENSDSEFANQMRGLIRQKILEGKSNQEIKKELLNEFGSDILTDSQNLKLKLIIFILIIFTSIFLIRKIS